GVARVAEDGGGHRPFAGVQAVHEAFGDRGRQLVEQGGAVVGSELTDDGGHLPGAQPGDQLGLVRGRQRFEHRQRGALVEHSEEDRGLGVRSRLDQIDEFDDRQRLRIAGELLQLGLALGSVAQQGLDGLGGRTGRGHPPIGSDAQDQGVREPGRRPDGPSWTRTARGGTGAENRCTLLREPKPLFRIAKLWPRWLAALTRRGENRSRAVVDAMARPDGAYSLLELSGTGTCAGVVDAHRAGRLPLRRGAARALTPPRLPEENA